VRALSSPLCTLACDARDGTRVQPRHPPNVAPPWLTPPSRLRDRRGLALRFHHTHCHRHRRQKSPHVERPARCSTGSCRTARRHLDSAHHIGVRVRVCLRAGESGKTKAIQPDVAALPDPSFTGSIRYEPVGVVVGITPFNFPLMVSGGGGGGGGGGGVT
jgi:hypothetical protein